MKKMLYAGVCLFAMQALANMDALFENIKFIITYDADKNCYIVTFDPTPSMARIYPHDGVLRAYPGGASLFNPNDPKLEILRKIPGNEYYAIVAQLYKERMSKKESV